MLERFKFSILVTFSFGIINALGILYEYYNRLGNYTLIFLVVSTIILIAAYIYQARFILGSLTKTYKEAKKTVPTIEEL